MIHIILICVWALICVPVAIYLHYMWWCGLIWAVIVHIVACLLPKSLDNVGDFFD